MLIMSGNIEMKSFGMIDFYHKQKERCSFHLIDDIYLLKPTTIAFVAHTIHNLLIVIEQAISFAMHTSHPTQIICHL